MTATSILLLVLVLSCLAATIATADNTKFNIMDMINFNGGECPLSQTITSNPKSILFTPTSPTIMFFDDYRSLLIRKVSGGITTSLTSGFAKELKNYEQGYLKDLQLYAGTSDDYTHIYNTMTANSKGELFLSIYSKGVILKISNSYMNVTKVAGTLDTTTSTDNQHNIDANSAVFSAIGIAAPSSNLIFVADDQLKCVRKIDLTTKKTTFFNATIPCDGSTDTPVAIASYSANIVYATKYCVRILTDTGAKFKTNSQMEAIYGDCSNAGSGTASDDNTGTSAKFVSIKSIATDPANGYIYVNDNGKKLRKIHVNNRNVFTVAGNGDTDPPTIDDADGKKVALGVIHGLAIHPSTKDLYMTIRTSNEYSMIRTFSGVMSGPVSTITYSSLTADKDAEYPIGCAIIPTIGYMQGDANLIHFSDPVAKKLYSYTPKTGTFKMTNLPSMKNMGLDEYPTSKFVQDGNYTYYVGDIEGNKLLRYDRSTNQVEKITNNAYTIPPDGSNIKYARFTDKYVIGMGDSTPTKDVSIAINPFSGELYVGLIRTDNNLIYRVLADGTMRIIHGKMGESQTADITFGTNANNTAFNVDGRLFFGFDLSGNLYYYNSHHLTFLKIDYQTNNISIVTGFNGATPVSRPIFHNTTVYYSYIDNNAGNVPRVVKVEIDGEVATETILGDENSNYACNPIFAPAAIEVDGDYMYLLCSFDYKSQATQAIYKIDMTNSSRTLLVGGGAVDEYNGPISGSDVKLVLLEKADTAFLNGFLYYDAANLNNRIMKVSVTTGMVEAVTKGGLHIIDKDATSSTVLQGQRLVSGNGAVYFVEFSSQNDVGFTAIDKYDPVSNVIQEIASGTANEIPISYGVFGSQNTQGMVLVDGFLYFFTSDGYLRKMDRNGVSQILGGGYASDYQTMYQLSTSLKGSSLYAPTQISSGPNGDLLLTYSKSSGILKISNGTAIDIIPEPMMNPQADLKANKPELGTFSPNGDIFYFENVQDVLQLKKLANGTIYSIAGSSAYVSDKYYTDPGVDASTIGMGYPTGILVLSDREILISLQAENSCDNGQNCVKGGMSRIVRLCPVGTFGEGCLQTSCFGINSNSSSVCSSHGSCVDYNTCQCNEKYDGNACAHYIYETTHGFCNDWEDCVCNSGWTGRLCNTPVCSGVAANETHVCNGKGQCISNNTCVCDVDWLGTNCQIPVCYGLNASNVAVVCSGNGDCISNNTCECDYGWSSDNCSIASCFNISSIDPTVCASHGECLGVDKCQCSQGWFGSDCSIHSCNNISAADPNTCGGHGTCNGTDSCVCRTGYSGQFCQNYTCFGIASTGSVCSNHGTCTGLDICQCSTYWTGAQCQTPICYGVAANESTVCSSHGDCINENSCKCQNGWTTDNCSIPICFNVDATTIGVCGGHGQCISNNSCQCENGWTGDNCTVPICYGVAANVQGVCYGHGECISKDTCQCVYGWNDFNCSTYSCFGIWSTNSTVCSGQGVCKSIDTCDCNYGYNEKDCSNHQCFGINSTSTQVCNGHGSCPEVDVCVCENKWFGSQCSIHSCFNIPANESTTCSGRGSCDSVDNCTCRDGYYGPKCDQFACFGIIPSDANVCSGMGQCVSPNKCSCFSSSNGRAIDDSCSTIQCLSTNQLDYINSTSDSVCSGHGDCLFKANDKSFGCSCDQDYTGTTCQTSVCFGVLDSDSAVCSGHGKCILNNTCECVGSWTGSKCEIPVCFTLDANNQNVCNKRGQCVSNDTCSCINGWSGYDCSIPTCNEIPATSPSVCSGNGKCILNNTCECVGSWTGSKCEIPICFTLDANNQNVCNKRGQCVSNDTCSCINGWSGSDCLIPSCNGIPATSPSVCSGHGKCTDLDQCVCVNSTVDGYWMGSTCSKCVPPYIGANCNSLVKCNATTMCNNHGYCNDIEQCTCYADNKKGFWKGDSCSSCDDEFYGALCSTKIVGPIRFMDDLTGLTLKVIAPASYSSSFTNSMILDCNKLLKSVDLLGTNPKCYWTNKETSEFFIELNTDYKLKAGDNLQLNTLYFDDSTQYLTFAVMPAASPKSPKAVVSGVKSTYGSCEDVSVDASESFSPDRKSLIFNWNVVSSPNKDALQNLLNSYTGSKMNISYSNINTGNHVIDLVVTSQVYSLTDKVTFTFEKLAYAVPVVSIDGLYEGNSITVRTSDVPISIKKKLTIPVCMDSSASISYTWEMISNSPQVQFTTDSFKNLKITKFNTIGNQQYVFQVKAFDTSNANRYSTAIVTLNTVSQPLSMSMYVLDSTPQYSTIGYEFSDPESENVQPTYSWTCINIVSNTACPAAVVNYLAASVLDQYKIEKSMVGSAEKIRITLNINKGSRSVQSSVDLILPQQAENIIMPPLVSVVQVSSTTVNKGDLVNIQLIASINGESNIDQHVTRTWLLNDKVIDSALTSQMSVKPSLSNSLIIDTQYLDEGSSNVISFSVVDKRNAQQATFSFSFSVNRPPKACVCEISPTFGTALTTLFNFNCENCQNDKKTYAFEYGFIDDFSGAFITLSKDEELYQKLPTPNAGDDLTLYVKVIDTETSATTISKKMVKITAPSVSKAKDIRDYITKWNTISSLLPAGDYARSVFNSATISRTFLRMKDSIFKSGRRSVLADCSGHGSLVNGKCVCDADYTTSDCKMTKEDFAILNEINQDLATAFFSSQQVKTENGEKMNGKFFTNIMFGVESLLKGDVSFDLFNKSLNIIQSTLDDAMSSPSFQVEVGADKLVISSLNSMHTYLKTLTSYDLSKLMESSHMLTSLLSRKVLVGQSAAQFETTFAIHEFNKQFKNAFDSQVLKESQTSLTLPSTVSQNLQSVSIRKPVDYVWMIVKDVSQYIPTKQEGKTLTIASDLSSIQFSTLVSNFSTPITHTLPLSKQSYTDKATYSCIQLVNGQVLDASSSCKFTYSDGKAICEGNDNILVGVMSSIPIETQPTTPVTPTSTKGISDLFWILWAFLIIGFIVIAFIVLGIVGYCVVKRMKPSTGSSNGSSNGIELKSV